MSGIMSSIGTVKSINVTICKIEENIVYQYTPLPVSGNYTVTAHDIADGTIITNTSAEYPQVLEYFILLTSPDNIVTFNNNFLLGTESSVMIMIFI